VNQGFKTIWANIIEDFSEKGYIAFPNLVNAAFSFRYMSCNRKKGWDDVSYTIPAMIIYEEIGKSRCLFFKSCFV